MNSPQERIYNDIKKQAKRILKIVAGILIIFVLIYMVLVTTQH